MGQAGADIRLTMLRPDGTAGQMTLNFDNNYSTNTFLHSSGQIFSANPWNGTGNHFGRLVNNGSAILNGTLDVLVDDITPLELMKSPNPPHRASTQCLISSCTVPMHSTVPEVNMVQTSTSIIQPR